MIRIIPLLLIKGSSIVKTVMFDECRVVGDAVSTVKIFSNRMADEMVVLDIEAGRKQGTDLNFELLERISRDCNMPIAIGGGIKSSEDAKRLIRKGADKVVVNSMLFENTDEVSVLVRDLGSQAVVLSIDIRKSGDEYYVYTSGGKVQQKATLDDVIAMANELEVGEVLLNSIDRDGVMQGYEIDLIEYVAPKLSMPLIVAGGCGNSSDCIKAVEAGASAISAGSIFHWIGESIITLKEDLLESGIQVRLK